MTETVDFATAYNSGRRFRVAGEEPRCWWNAGDFGDSTVQKFYALARYELEPLPVVDAPIHRFVIADKYGSIRASCPSREAAASWVRHDYAYPATGYRIAEIREVGRE